jgi:alpha-tubulin suppressor-like RCC1 family protein
MRRGTKNKRYSLITFAYIWFLFSSVLSPTRIYADGEIIAWGDNSSGQCNVPEPNTDFKAIASGHDHSLGLKSDGSVVAWGKNDYGQCNVPLPNTGFIAVAAGYYHSLALKSDGSIVGWGNNYDIYNQTWYGQATPPAGNNFIAIAAGEEHSLGLRSDGSIAAWGAGQPGLPFAWPNFGQCDVPPLNGDFIAISAGMYHSLGLKTNGSIVAWGFPYDGACDVPPPNSNFKAISAGWRFSLGLKNDGLIVAFGSGGECNHPPLPNAGFKAISAGWMHCLGLKTDGSIVGWGDSNYYGECTAPEINSGFTAIATGYFRSLGIKGDPCDRDGDGLLDTWEIEGIDVDGDGTVDLDLPALGADPNHKDLFVEVDAMIGRAPAPATLARVANAFAIVPNTLVKNPDGNDGINLHIQLDETDIPLASWTTPYPNCFLDFDSVKNVRFGTPAQRASGNWAHIKEAKMLAYRYCIFANTYNGLGGITTSSGLSELPGNDFMVTLGGWVPAGGTPDQQAASFMHEFGHNLGLRHGGQDKINYKPNYHSIMNYTWQIPDMRYAGSWVLDYSREAFPVLDETNLNESVGIGGHLGHIVPAGPPPLRLVNENGPVDWNRDNDTNDIAIAADITQIEIWLPASPNEILYGYNDWSSLRYPLSGHGNFQNGVHTEITDEMTFELYQILNRFGCAPADLNCDSHINFSDFAIFAEQWLQSPGFPSADIAPAPEGDGIVEIMDIALFAENWLIS